MKKPTKADLQFNAILAKNEIARALRDYVNDCARFKRPMELSIVYLRQQLRDIERFTGESNQPNVDEVYNNISL